MICTAIIYMYRCKLDLGHGRIMLQLVLIFVFLSISAFKVGTHDGVPATSPCNKSQELVASCQLAIFATKSSRRDQILVLRLVPRIQTGLNLWD